jgi:hypothetical protein
MPIGENFLHASSLRPATSYLSPIAYILECTSNNFGSVLPASRIGAQILHVKSTQFCGLLVTQRWCGQTELGE